MLAVVPGRCVTGNGNQLPQRLPVNRLGAVAPDGAAALEELHGLVFTDGKLFPERRAVVRAAAPVSKGGVGADRNAVAAPDAELFRVVRLSRESGGPLLHDYRKGAFGSANAVLFAFHFVDRDEAHNSLPRKYFFLYVDFTCHALSIQDDGIAGHACRRPAGVYPPG